MLQLTQYSIFSLISAGMLSTNFDGTLAGIIPGSVVAVMKRAYKFNPIKVSPTTTNSTLSSYTTSFGRLGSSNKKKKPHESRTSITVTLNCFTLGPNMILAWQ